MPAGKFENDKKEAWEYYRRIHESGKPITPRTTNARIITASGTVSSEFSDGFSYTGRVMDGGGVNVGSLVEVGATLNCAAKVGSTVEVGGCTGVGGGAIICKLPGETVTNGEYTQPLLSGAPGNSI